MTVIAHRSKQRPPLGAPPAKRQESLGTWRREHRLPAGSRLRCFLHLTMLRGSPEPLHPWL